nr:hypothetical protein [Nocardiopsis xinjiangensis]
MRFSTDAYTRASAVLHDGVALDEIELYAEVLIAAARTDRPLSPDELDQALGVGEDAPEPPSEQPRHGFLLFNRIFTKSA